VSHQNTLSPRSGNPQIVEDFLEPLKRLRDMPILSQKPQNILAGGETPHETVSPGSGASIDDSTSMSSTVAATIVEQVDIVDKIQEVEPPKSRNVTKPGSGTGDSGRTLKIEYYDAKLTDIESEVAFAAYYLGTNLMGAALDFNRKFRYFGDALKQAREADHSAAKGASDFSIERFIELGIIVGNLGALSLFPIPPEMCQSVDPGIRILPEYLMLGGLGAPGSLTRDDVRFVLTNVVYGAKAMRKTHLSTHLIGTHSRSLNIRQSLRAIVEGIKEGMERFDIPEMTLKIAYESKAFRYAESQIRSTLQYLEEIFEDEILIQYETKSRRPTVVADPAHDGASFIADSNVDEVLDQANFTRLTVTSDRSEDAILTGRISESTVANAPSRWKNLKYSALTSNSAIPTRMVQIQNSFAEMLPNTVLDVRSFQDQWEYGNLMMHCFIPDDFQKLIEEGDKLTLIVDRETARIPWEMSGYSAKNAHRFFGTHLEISRQFRSIVGCTNAHPPELNHELKVLIIADPVTDPIYSLEGAVEEGFAVAELFAQADKENGGKLGVQVHLRIGNANRAGGDPAYRTLMKERFLDARSGFANPRNIDTDFCRSIEILKLLVHEQFDIVHFAGHGKFVPETGEMGWMLDDDCTLTAKEIFRVRQVPRLVFANACRSGEMEQKSSAEPQAETAAADRTLPESVIENLYREIALYRNDSRKRILFSHMSMAEAFFARGIPNFVGTGWNVHDEQAFKFALAFYDELLKVDAETGNSGKSVGESLRLARHRICTRPEPQDGVLRVGSENSRDMVENSDHPIENHNFHNTWGAYQHYGIPTDRLFVLKSGTDEN
jgi:hypothetical protein